MRFNLSFVAAAALVLGATAGAQSNVIPGTDVETGIVNNLSFMGSTNSSTLNGFSMATTSCNAGSVNVPWLSPMQENHPVIAFIMVREEPGDQRLIQISDYSYLKHGFFALSNSQCYPCQNPSNGTFLGVGCSDTYGIGNNGDRFYLGPAEEIDPWLGTWSALGSFFDCPNGTGCDGNRSYFGSEPNSVNHRVEVPDSELGVAGADYFYGNYYVIRGEPEAARENNMAHRTCDINPSGSNWSVNGDPPSSEQQGTILQRWTGAQLSSNTNGTADGRVHVAWKITDNGDGTWHYEYAFHNRDNNGAIAEFRIPSGTMVSLTNVGFHDIDQNAGNDWALSQTTSEIVFSTTGNPLRWNSIYNVWFDADAPPTGADIELTQFTQNPGAASSFDVAAQGPGTGAPDIFFNVCNGDGGDGAGCTDCPCGNNAAPGTVGGCLNSNSTSAQLQASGTNSVSAGDLRIEMIGATPNSFAVLTSGENVAPTNAANACFGLDSGVQSIFLDGLRCAVTNTQRHGGRPVDFAGRVGVFNNGWGPPNGPAGGLAASSGFSAGQTRHFQIFYRELPGTSCGREQNTTQATTTTFAP